MRKLFSIIFSLLFLIQGCSPYISEIPNYTVKMIYPVESTDLTYSDEIISITFSIKRDGISFILKNKTTEELIVSWYKGTITYPSGRNLTPRLIDGEKLVSTTKISPYAEIKGNLAGYIGRNEIERELFNYNSLKDGAYIGISFPIEIQGVKKKTINYKFTFLIELQK